MYCTKVSGRWLFPRAALDRWVMAGLITSAALAQAAAPPIVGGSHDLLLELTLRESGCGLASLPEGRTAGLRRLTRGEVMIAAIHLHDLESDDAQARPVTPARQQPPRRSCFVMRWLFMADPSLKTPRLWTG
jgi:putative molybdopterin biosynthesis protein